MMSGIKDIIEQNANIIIEPIAPELGINYGSSPLLEYSYPPVSETIVKNITNAIIAVPKLYTQVLHLMNKMNLPPPFGPVRKRPDIPKSSAIPIVYTDEVKYYGPSMIKAREGPEEEESDNSADDFESKRQKIEDSSSNPFSRTEVITSQPAQESQSKVIAVEKQEIKSMFITPASVRTCLSRQDILKNRISKEEMTQNKAFNNYSYGETNSKLYLRNMNKDVNADDLLKLFGCFFDNDDIAKELFQIRLIMYRSLEIRVMDGRMKGQAFVTFPDVETAREALTTVNGYIMKEKPIVISFSKQG